MFLTPRVCFCLRNALATQASQATLRIAQAWLGQLAAAVRTARPGIALYMYSAMAKFGQGFQLNSWPMLRDLGFADTPSYYSLMQSLERMANNTRQERLAIGTARDLHPWVSPGQTPGTGGVPPVPGSAAPHAHAGLGVAMFNSLIQLFANGATGFNMYTSDGFVDMQLWLAVRDVVELVVPFEDLLMDGSPAPPDTFFGVAASAVVGAMADSAGTLLVASSTLPHGAPTQFSLRAARATAAWRLCDLRTKRSVAASASGVAVWQAAAELGTLLTFGPATPCHVAG